MDYAEVAWKDRIRFRVLTVDHDAREMTGEFVEQCQEASELR